MGVHDIKLLTIGIFDAMVKGFWIEKLSDLLVRFPELEVPSRKDFYTLMIVEEAEGEIWVDNDKIQLDIPKIIIIKPDCISSLRINREAKGKIICFTEDFFSLRYNHNILHQFSFLQRGAIPYIRLSMEQKTRWTTFLQLFSEEYHARKPESKKVLSSYLNILLFELERLFKPNKTPQQKNPRQEKVDEFTNLVSKYFETKKLPSAYAKLLHISPNYLNKICKEATGHTAGDLIRSRIAIESQRLLHYTNGSVKEIADKLGFENTSYFVTFFKKQTGVTPEQFRKNQN